MFIRIMKMQWIGQNEEEIEREIVDIDSDSADELKEELE